MTRRNQDLEYRLDQAEAEIADIKDRLEALGATKAELAAMRQDVDFLRSELQARGVGPIPNPGERRTKLPEGTVKAIRAQGAAHARASKEVGTGQGKVSSRKIQRKLHQEARGKPKRGS